MLQIVLLVGKFAFLIILFLFIFYVIRSSTRELRSAAPAPGGPRWLEQQSAASQPRSQATPGAVRDPSPAGTWTLVVDKSPTLPVGSAYSFPLGVRALAGRSGDMDICLDDTFVSSKHALFETTLNGLQVEDLRSTNGTQVNGTDISEPRVLRIGDRVEVGDTVFRVEVR
jgi:hypothetical protein